MNKFIHHLKSEGLIDIDTVIYALSNDFCHKADVESFIEDYLLTLDKYDLYLTIENASNLEIVNMLLSVTSYSENNGKQRCLLAALRQININEADDEIKIQRLQEVYADFGYPENMTSCSIYSADGVPPLEAMTSLIKNLTISYAD